MVKIAAKVAQSQELLIKKIAAETGALIAGGAKLVNMSQGVPCLPIFAEAKTAIKHLLDTDNLPYSDVPGLAPVRDTAAEFVNKFYSNDDKQFAFSAAHSA
jgi:aspartate/methionine/tyrosine aminotransferase